MFTNTYELLTLSAGGTTREYIGCEKPTSLFDSNIIDNEIGYNNKQYVFR